MSIFTDLDRLIMIISAIVHDLDHPGTNNLYQINKKTDLASSMIISVLERHIDLSNGLFKELNFMEALHLSDSDREIFFFGRHEGSDLIYGHGTTLRIMRNFTGSH